MAKIETKDEVKADVALFGSMKTDKDRSAAIDKMGIGASDATLNRRVSVFMWALGKNGGNAVPDVVPYYDAINAKMRGGSTGRAIISSEKTLATYRSYYRNFAELGFVKTWDTTSVLVWILDNVKGEYSTRGKFMKSVIALNKEPSAEELAAMWKEHQSAPKLDGKAIAMAKAVKELAKEPTFVPTLRDNQSVRIAYQKFVLASAAFEAAVKSAGGSAGEGEEDALAEIMKDAA